LKKVGVVSGFIKKSKGFHAILAFSEILQNCFCIVKSWIGSTNHESTAGSRSMVDSRPKGGAAAPGLGRSS
jgi:hypothetical protein